MTDKGDIFRVSVYYQTDEERDLAESALESVRPGHTHVYCGVIDGWLTSEELEKLNSAGMTVVLTGESIKKSLVSSSLDKSFQDQLDKLQDCAPPPPVNQGNDFYVVRLKDPLRKAWRKELETVGEVVSYVPPDFLRLRLSQEGLKKLSNLPYIKSATRYGIAETVTPDLLRALEETDQAKDLSAPMLSAVAAGETVQRMTLDIALYHPEDRDQVLQVIAENNSAKIVGKSATAMRVECDLDRNFIATLADLPEVKKLSIYNPPSCLCDRARKLVGVETINIGNQAHWNGEGEIVGVFDSGIDSSHPDLVDRILINETISGASEIDKVGHGTHVAGIIAGTGAASAGQICGMAPGAKLVVFGITNEQGKPQIDQFVDLGELLKLATEQGAKIINLSWGEAISGSYNQGSRSVDEFVYNHPDVLIIVAAGNEGREGQNGELEFNTIGTPASAKNVLTVGASATDRCETPFRKTWAEFRPAFFSLPRPVTSLVAGDPDLHAADSSCGPTDFDSVKPDILAPGTFILSTRAANTPDRQFWMNCENHEGRYGYMGGTSMAAPIVTGLAAVLRQYVTKGLGVPSPSAALLKAMLIASAKKLPSCRAGISLPQIGYPDFDQGFGRVDLSNILPLSSGAPNRKLLFVDIPNDSPEALESRAPPGSLRKAMRSYSIRAIANPTEPLRIVLVWTDKPGNDIQNNLQLEIRSSGQRQVGNQHHLFRKDPAFDDRNADNIPYDKHNNIELALIEKEQQKQGDYEIRVFAQNTPSPPQGYALCVCGELESDTLRAIG